MEKILNGRIWVIADKDGKKINDIDTDMIFHNRYLAITDISKMGEYSFDNLKDWEDFSKKAKKGDILIVGENFGAGSSRQQAVDCFISLGIQAIVGESFGAIYKRNAINSGIPLIEAVGIFSNGKFSSGEEIELNIVSGEIKNISQNKIFKASPLSKVAMDIYEAKGLMNL
jgi:3-isopropylmalate/(R)-2-methylmalate dehydratase small subunit